MKRILFLSAIIACIAMSGCQKSETYVEIETEYGTMKAVLYDDTPLHKENFIKLANEGFYDGLIFHRVINQFMVQGGDPDSKNATAEQSLGAGGPGYKIDAEIKNIHVKGALAAARTNNPQKQSSGSQYYIVHGNAVTESMLSQATMRHKLEYTPEQKQEYLQNGGYPWLDNEYTVFGKVVEGLDVIDKIAAVPIRQGDNRPLQDVKMKVRVVK